MSSGVESLESIAMWLEARGRGSGVVRLRFLSPGPAAQAFALRPGEHGRLSGLFW